VERPVLNLQDLLGRALDVFGNLMAVRRPQKQSAQNQHIESALQEFPAIGSGSGCHDSRPSTITKVDALPSIWLADICRRERSWDLLRLALFSIELGPALVQIIDRFLRRFHFHKGGLKAGSVTGDFSI